MPATLKGKLGAKNKQEALACSQSPAKKNIWPYWGTGQKNRQIYD